MSVTVLVPLDLRSAFDTVDCNLLLNRLEHCSQMVQVLLNLSTILGRHG